MAVEEKVMGQATELLQNPFANRSADQSEPLVRKHWTRSEFHRAIDSGILEDADRLELIDGELFVMAPQSRRHFKTIMRASQALRVAFGEGFSVETQGPAG